MIMDDSTIRVCDFGASAAIDPGTGRVSAMPIEINELEQQLGSLDGSQNSTDENREARETRASSESRGAHDPNQGSMTPYTLRKVTQVGTCLTPQVSTWSRGILSGY